MAYKLGKTYSDIWAELGASGDYHPDNVQPETETLCDGYGAWHGVGQVFAGGSCGVKYRSTDPQGPFPEDGWWRYPANATYWRWVNMSESVPDVDPDNPANKYSMTKVGHWRHPANLGMPPALNFVPGTGPQGRPRPEPEEFPMIDPMTFPCGLPAPVPVPIPYRLIPRRRPNQGRIEQTDRGNHLPRPTPKPLPRPARPPSWPPPPRTKERKANLRGAALIGLAMSVTEAVDVLDAFWEALPKECQSKHQKGAARATERLKDVYKCFPHMDLEMALENVVLNWIEDGIIGLGHRMRDFAISKISTGRGAGFDNRWQHKALDPRFEKDVAKWVNDNFEDFIRDFIEFD